MAEYIKQEMSEQMAGGQLEKKAYYRLKTYSNFSMEEFIDFMVNNQGLKEGEVLKVISGMVNEVAHILALGHSVTIDGLGTFRASRGKQAQRAECGREECAVQSRQAVCKGC